MADPLIVASRLPGDPPFKSAYPVQDVVCEDRFFGYWEGLNAVWASDRTIINVEHDQEFSDDLVAELLSCPYDLCAYPYRVTPFGWPGQTWGATYGSVWVSDGDPYAMFSSIGFCKITAPARAGTELERLVWDKVEQSVHRAVARCKRLWHLHWPAIQHYHDYGDFDAEAASMYSMVKRARDEGRLLVYGDEFTDADLEGLKANDPYIFDESLRPLAEALCPD
jgi:hypothetical protein